MLVIDQVGVGPPRAMGIWRESVGIKFKLILHVENMGLGLIWKSQLVR